MKKIISVLLLISLCLSVFVGCDDGSSQASSNVTSSTSSSASATSSETQSRITRSEVDEMLSGNTSDDGVRFSIPDDDYIIPPETKDENLYYFYHNLPTSLKDSYCRLVAALGKCEMTCQLETAPTESELALLYYAITFDHPQFFHMYSYEQANHFAFSPNDDSLIYIMYDFQVSETNASPDIEEIASLYNQINQALEEPLAEAKKYSSVFDQVSYMYYWLVDNTQISWSDHNEHPHSTLKELILDKHGVCIGYALTLSYIYRQLGIETTIGFGVNSSNVEHTWCIPKLDGKYYACDAYFGNEHRVNFEHSSAEFVLMSNYEKEEEMQVTPYALVPGPALG